MSDDERIGSWSPVPEAMATDMLPNEAYARLAR